MAETTPGGDIQPWLMTVQFPWMEVYDCRKTGIIELFDTPFREPVRKQPQVSSSAHPDVFTENPDRGRGNLEYFTAVLEFDRMPEAREIR